MRVLAANQELAQALASRTPYIKLEFTSKDTLTTVDLSTDSAAYPNRILLIDHTEEPYNDYAYIMLRDNDRSIPDLKGYWTEIGYGDYYSGTAYSSPTSRMWVKEQRIVSARGRLYTLLVLTGTWSLLAEQPILMGTIPVYNDAGATTLSGLSIYDCILQLTIALNDSTTFAMILESLVQSDGIVDIYVPGPEIDTIDYASLSDLVQQLMSWTKCFIRIKAGRILSIIYPQDSDTPDKTYYSYQYPYFFDFVNSDNLVVPNRVIVFCNQDQKTGSWPDDPESYAGEAVDQDSIDAYMEAPGRIYLAGLIAEQADAQLRAEAILCKIKAGLVTGQMICPHDAALELYDLINIDDFRGF